MLLNNRHSTILKPIPISYRVRTSLYTLHKKYLFDNVIIDFDGEEEEDSILIQLGKQSGLNMHDILQYTYTHLFEKALENVSAVFCLIIYICIFISEKLITNKSGSYQKLVYVQT